MLIIITNKEFIEKLPEDDRLEYQRLKGMEDLGKALGKEVPEDVKEKLEQYSKKVKELMGIRQEEALYISEIPQELNDFRKAWKINMEDISNDSKEHIIKAAENIPVKIDVNAEGTRVITLIVGSKKYEILDPNLENHIVDKYKALKSYGITDVTKTEAKFSGLQGNDVSKWECEKLKEYVQDKIKEGRQIPKIEKVKKLLKELGHQSGLHDKNEQVAMLMYLTGMEGSYRLSMGNEEVSKNGHPRSLLFCQKKDHRFSYGGTDWYSANLCMMKCE